MISGVGVLDKAMHLLDIVEYSQPISLAELVDKTGFPKTTAHRLTMALETHGFLRRTDDSRLVTGTRFATGILSQVAEPILRKLTDDTGESSQLYVRRGEQRLCVVSIESREELRTTVPVGALLTLERGGPGRLLGGKVSPRAGWVESIAERAPGVASVSAPVYDGGVLVAALAISGPVGRLGTSPGRRYSKKVVAAARRVERALASAHG